MLKDITLGQYFPGKSLLHRLDPRIKILITIIYISALFCAKNLYGFAAMLIGALILCVVSGISAKVLLKSIKPLLFILIFTALINTFLSKNGELLFEFYFISVYSGGLINAAFMIIRIVSLILGTSILLTYTTTPDNITDAIERLLKPLAAIRVPVHEFAMMMMLALRFIPPLVEETEKIMNAQKARGANFEGGGLITKAKSLVPVIIPLIISSFRRAGELATAMECRCYNGGKGRTRMKQTHMHIQDLFMFIMSGAFLALLIMLNYIDCSIRLI